MRNGLLLLAWRFLKARPLRSGVAVVSVALGVGLLAVLLTLNASADVALERQIAEQFGTYDMMAGYRKPDTRLSEQDLARMGEAPGVKGVAGVLIPYMAEHHRELLGVSYYGAPDTPLGRQMMKIGEGAFPGAGEAAVAPAWAKAKGLEIGDTVDLAFPAHGTRPVRISGLLATSKRLGTGIVLFERGWLEEATGRPGATFALLEVGEGANKAMIANTLQEMWPELDVDQGKHLEELRQNLNAMRPVALGMGAAALLASVFLLTGAFRMSLAERTRELAMLRAIAATPGQVRRLILAEALVTGVLGAAAGAGAGVGGAVASAGAVARLLGTAPGPAAVPLAQVAAAPVAGVLLALAAALGVARAAGRTEPLRAMRPDLPEQEASARGGGRFGILLAVLGAIALAATPFLPTGPEAPLEGGLRPLVGSTGGLAIGLGLILGAQRLLPILLPLLARPFAGRTEGPVAVRSLLRHRRRSGNTVAALSLGLVLILSLSTLATTVVRGWHDNVRKQHPADIQFEVPTIIQRGAPPDLASRVAEIPGVTHVGQIADDVTAVMVDFDFGRADPEWLREVAEWEAKYQNGPGPEQRSILSVSAANLPTLVEMGVYRLIEGDLSGFSGKVVAVADTMARDRGIRLGDTLKLKQLTSLRSFDLAGAQPYQVVAIVQTTSWRMPEVLAPAPIAADGDRLRMVYANARPELLAAARAEARTLVQSMEYNLAEYSDAESALAELQKQTAQRFALLAAVGVVMAVVAAMSLMNAMAAGVAERRREFALLRSVGATPAQVRNMVLLEAGLLGAVGAVVGVTGGVVLGVGAMFGLDVDPGQIRLPWAVMLGGLGASVLLGLLAAMGPARRVMLTSPAEAVRAD